MALNGDYRQALFLFKQYRSGIVVNTRHWIEVNMNIGMCYFRLHQYVEAEMILIQILEIDPLHKEALEKLKLVHGFISSKISDE